MTTAFANDVVRTRGRVAAVPIAPALAVAAFSSIGAGAIHATAAGAHSEHRSVVITFALTAIAQLAWGVLALTPSGRSRVLVFSGAAINLAAFVGWVLAKTSGIGFITGLDVAETPQFADTTAAIFAAIAVIGAVLAATVWRDVASWFGVLPFGLIAIATAGVTMAAMVSTGSHSHGATGTDHHGGETTAAHSHGSGGTGGDMGHESDPGHAVVVPPKPYDPDKPIDLGGVEGVTEEEQARAENLIAITLARLPKYEDYRVAERDGFHSIGDAVTGDEHFIKESYFVDEHILNPDYPESLVYKPMPDGSKRLAAAMFMANPGTKLTEVPNVGGKLTQWHIHNNLCFTADARVAGIRDPNGPCPPGLNGGVDSPMIHVWIEPHPCGPFAALEGIGGGQILPGETKLCDAAHGHP
jgi:hypothetical protein